tara:strand:+ start:119 stop:838 length:720 start_codon:yes stop_codon:yes gene_type:complete
MSEEEFEPRLKIWMLEHFQTMASGAIWRPEGTGLRYRKEGETTLILEHRVDHPDSIHHHERMKRLCNDVAIVVEDDDVMVTSPALSAEEAYMREIQERQMDAARWTCKCDKKLADFDFEQAPPVYLNDREILLDNGDTASVEEWAIKLYCANCDDDILMNPDDYNILAGDALFMRYRSANGDWLKAMTRGEMLETAEAGATGILVGKTCPLARGKVPPWMWGTYCDIIVDKGEDKGEEE